MKNTVVCRHIKVFSFSQDVDDSNITVPAKPDDQLQTSTTSDELATDELATDSGICAIFSIFITVILDLQPLKPLFFRFISKPVSVVVDTPLALMSSHCYYSTREIHLSSKTQL